MECFAVAFVAFIVWGLVTAVRSAWEQRSSQHDSPYPGSELKLRYERDQITLGGRPELLYKVYASGGVMVPHEMYDVAFKTRITDTTNDPHPVFCMIPECADEYGVYAASQEIRIPYLVSQFRDMPVAVIPAFALMTPARGRRRLTVTVRIIPTSATTSTLTSGSLDIFHEQKKPGFLELEEYAVECEEMVARLALAICAADGHIDDREAAVVRRYFSERLARREAQMAHRVRINQLLTRELEVLCNVPERGPTLIPTLCRAIAEQDNPALSHAAYELCVEVVAADGIVQEPKWKALSEIARLLSIPDEIVREVHDRVIAIEIECRGVAEEELLGVPHHLSHEQKIDFLNGEFRRWRG